MVPVPNQVLVFLFTIDGQQTILVWSRNDTLVCKLYVVVITSSVTGIVNFMWLVMPAAACLLILGSLGSITIAQWAQ
jgi:hypothetical protein